MSRSHLAPVLVCVRRILAPMVYMVQRIVAWARQCHDQGGVETPPEKGLEDLSSWA